MNTEPNEAPSVETPDEASPLTVPKPLKGRRYLCLAILGVSLLMVVLLRLHSLDEPLEGDEATYMMMAKVWEEGGRPYEGLWDNKPVGTFIIYRVGLALFGYDQFTPRVLSILATLTTTILLSWILWRRPIYAQLLALVVVWPMLSVWVPCHANGANMEVFLLPFILGAYGLLREYTETRREACWYGAVLVLVLSLLVKQVTLPLLVMPFAALRYQDWRKRKMICGRFAAVIAGVLLLPMVVYGITGFGIFFPFDQLARNAGYGAGSGGIFRRLLNWVRLAVLLPMDKSLLYLLPCSVAGILGLGVVLKERKPGWLLKLSLVIGSVGAVVLPGQNTPHYYILALPALTLAAVWFYLSSRRRPWLITIPIILLLALGYHTSRQYLSKTPVQISTAKYGLWFVADRKLGEWLRQQEVVNKRIYVEGSHAPVYFYSGNTSASRFHCHYPVSINAVTAEEMMADLMQSEPEYLVLLYSDEPPLPGFRAWRETNYTLEHKTPVRLYRRKQREPDVPGSSASDL